MDGSSFDSPAESTLSSEREMRFGRANHRTFLNIRDCVLREIPIDKIDEVINEESSSYILGTN
ncbi:hypothetical protein LP316_08080 [Thalassotalea sp. LPB0316]|uniref:hypothetical protein n=1 Tax=Thalassotalea sp. LPB0316 TaxID=2769490 RepID=UPI001867A484|nr:hypothetical protein [Thalassotalea sp. LPB0316]QOL24341.1 hypothetical protein LP316_08080 [Thalassotalea sp. LPB0316]